MKDNLLFWYLKGNLKNILLNLIFLLILMGVFVLYGITLEPFWYAVLICLWIGTIFFLYDFMKYYKKHHTLMVLRKQIDVNLIQLPVPHDLIEKDYQDNLKDLHTHRLELISTLDSKQTEMIDYYTLWAHQIKTPISAMRLLLQTESHELNKELLAELFKIEQYVEMVLGYLRIESTSSDLVFQKYELAPIIKQSIRKYASQFIRKNIKLEFNEMETIVLTDEKWLVFVLDQLLSNALKYTNRGTISIYMDSINPTVLVIEDTGIGIAEEDLPRIFEKGFTGYNGRMDKKATGLGLYLCQRILSKLSHQINIKSSPKVGTKVMIDLSFSETTYE